jgi:proteasome lid subunit RPN8/RPN11
MNQEGGLILKIPAAIMEKIQAGGEKAYPEEGAGFLLGKSAGNHRQVLAFVEMDNNREAPSRARRYLLTPEDYTRAERAAENQGFEILGVYHSHPDHPDIPSDYDLEWAMPWFSYLITSVRAGKRNGSRAWRLSDDRSGFVEEMVFLTDQTVEI